MKTKIRNIATGALILAVPGLVLLRSVTDNHFKPDAELRAHPSYSHSVVVSPEQVNIMDGNRLIVNIGNGTELDNPALPGNSVTDVLHTDASSLLSRMNRKKILNFKGNVFLVSGDPSLSSGLWMVLSQMGRKDLFIVSDKVEPEVFKYEFRPDTMTLPEF